MHLSVCDVFYSQCSHQPVFAAIMAVFRVMLLQAYKGTNVSPSLHNNYNYNLI